MCICVCVCDCVYVHLCMYVNVCMYMHTFLYTRMHTRNTHRVYVYAHVCVCACVFMCTYVCTLPYTHTHTHTHTHKHAYIHTCSHSDCAVTRALCACLIPLEYTNRVILSYVLFHLSYDSPLSPTPQVQPTTCIHTMCTHMDVHTYRCAHTHTTCAHRSHIK